MKTALKLRAKVYEIIHPDGIPLERFCEIEVQDEPFIVYRVSHDTDTILCVRTSEFLAGQYQFSTGEDSAIVNIGKPLTLLRCVEGTRPARELVVAT